MSTEDSGARSPERASPARARARLAIEAAFVGLIALAGRLPAIDHAPYVDELNHVLAARSFLEDGTMRVADGAAAYERAWLFTRLVAEFFRLFGESLVVARLPAVIAGAAIVVLLFLWVRSFAGRLSAWIAALLLCFSPGALFLSQLCRFYSFQALFFLAGALCVLRLSSRPLSRPRTLAAVVGAGVFFSLALHLHKLSVVGVGAVGLWAVLALVPWALRARGRSRLILVAVSLAALASLLAGAPQVLSRARLYWAMFNQVDIWAAGDRGNLRYYHWLFLEQYATIWALFPVFSLLAIRVRRREAGFCLAVFGLAFAVQSLAAWKSERYLFYAMPFFFAIVGVGLGEAIPWLLSAFEDAVRSAGLFVRRAAAARACAVVLALFAAAFAVAGSGAFSFASRMVAGSDAHWPFERTYRGEPDWRAAARHLRDAREEGAVLVGSSDLKALYYFGRLDYALSYDLRGDSRRVSPEFAPHWKTLVPVVSEPESLRRIVDSHPSGLVVVEKKQIRKSWGVPAPAADFLEQNLEEVPLPPEWRLRAFRWGVAEARGKAPSGEPAR
ncbi:MAG: glycosyltransferase family 39 protein [Candidatus Eisenbacteria bacterium]